MAKNSLELFSISLIFEFNIASLSLSQISKQYEFFSFQSTGIFLSSKKKNMNENILTRENIDLKQLLG